MTADQIMELAKGNKRTYMEVIELGRMSMTPCYDSKWKAVVKNMKGDIETITIQRFDNETEERLKSKIEDCRDFDDVRNLWISVYFD